jgi:hypothetical protein
MARAIGGNAQASRRKSMKQNGCPDATVAMGPDKPPNLKRLDDPAGLALHRPPCWVTLYNSFGVEVDTRRSS